ncbi:longitudinals lacking protein [Eurosta solidaginis]|uniref:longitudinals lacking protein n=1 Tax=Eurosta solidaginis TaxID=178769 RepID=UPI003530799C
MHGVKRLNARNVTVTTTTITTEPVSGLAPATATNSQTEPRLKKNTSSSVNTNRKNMSMSDVSDMLIELYKANVANAPKNQQQSVIEKLRQNSPSSAESNEPSSIAAIATKGASAAVNESKNLQSDEMVKITNEKQQKLTLTVKNIADIVAAPSVVDNSPFHQPINIINTTKNSEQKSINDNAHHTHTLPSLSAIPVPVVVTPNSPQIDIKPLIHPTTGLVISAVPSNPSIAATNLSVIKAVPNFSNIAVPALASLSSNHDDVKSIQGQHNNNNGNSTCTSDVNVLPQAAVIAAALLRDNYNNFHQQMRTQELINEKVQNNMNECAVGNDTNTSNPNISTKILESLLRQQRERRFKFENESNNAETNAIDGDDEDDSRYNDFDDIHLVEQSKANSLSGIFHPTASTSTARLNSTNLGYMSDDSQKIMFAAQAQALRQFDYSFSDGGNNSYGNMGNDGILHNSDNGDGIEAVYECRHCGKKYRWKSTLRRHENVECGGKEPSHQCPYCPYKSKQRGNLGVHVRKHHSDLPQLASKRRSKYSHKLDNSNNSANASDDSSSRLVIDCSK